MSTVGLRMESLDHNKLSDKMFKIINDRLTEHKILDQADAIELARKILKDEQPDDYTPHILTVLDLAERLKIRNHEYFLSNLDKRIVALEDKLMERG